MWPTALAAERDARQRAEAERDRLRGLVERAFEEGFNEGINDVMRSRGGKTWYDSRARASLGEPET